MKRTLAVAAAAVGAVVTLLALSACSGLTPATVTSDVQQAQQACITVQPLLSVGAASSNATAQSVAGFGNAMCGPLAAGSPPATVNSSTATWLGTLAGMIKVLVPVAAALL